MVKILEHINNSWYRTSEYQIITHIVTHLSTSYEWRYVVSTNNYNGVQTSPSYW